MDEQALRDLISSLLRENEEVLMRTSKYHDGKKDSALKLVLSDLFNDVGVRRIDAKSDANGSEIKVYLNGGATVKGETIPFPISGTVTINGEFGKLIRPINGPQAISLVSTMRKVWDDYLSAGK